jgi:Cytochrome c554 and c-prime
MRSLEAAALVCVATVASARMPGPSAQGAAPARGHAAEENAACEKCHVDIAREWRTSMHAQSDTDRVYRRALAREPLPFCRACHAPEADPRLDAPPELSALGIGCVTCHVTAGGSKLETLAAPHPSTVAAPHAILRTADFAGVPACASCHEFDFPVHAPGRPAERMQSTVSEHAKSTFADTSCATCHMPTVQGASGKHKSHLFESWRDLALLRGAVHVTAQRTSTSRVHVALSPARVGHAMPTGDLFRRLRVTAEVIGDDWAVLAEASQSLHRRFEMQKLAAGGTVRHMVDDDRVGSRTGPIDLELELGAGAAGHPIAWRVEYQRVEHPVGDDDGDAVVADSVVIAEGTLSPGTP